MRSTPTGHELFAAGLVIGLGFGFVTGVLTTFREEHRRGRLELAEQRARHTAWLREVQDFHDRQMVEVRGTGTPRPLTLVVGSRTPTAYDSSQTGAQIAKAVRNELIRDAARRGDVS